MKAYLIAWNDALEGGGQISRDQLIEFIDKVPQIVNWRSTLRSIFIASELSPQGIHEIVHRKYPKLHFIVAEVSLDTVWGWADQKTWDFIEKPKPA